MPLQVVPTKSSSPPNNTWSPEENNTYIRDNFRFCVPGIFTAKGDLFIGTGANAGTVLPVGTNGQVFKTLTAADLDVGWGVDFMANLIGAKGDLLAGTAADTADNLPVGTNGQILSALAAGAGGMGLSWIDKVISYARCGTNAGQTLTEPETINFDGVAIDTSGAVTIGASWKYTAPAAGYYLVAASILTTANTYDGPFYLRLYKNGALEIIMAERRFSNAVSSINKPLRGATLVYLSATHYIAISGGCTDGDITLVSDSYHNYVTIMRLGIA